MDDRARHAARRPFLAEPVDHVGQLGFLDISEQLCGAGSAALIHPHVQRFVPAETEAAPFGVELHRRHAEVGQNAINAAIDAARGLGDSPLVEYAIQVAVIGVHQLDAIAESGERLPREREGLRIAIEREHACRPSLEQGAAMAAETHGAVHEQPSLRRVHELEDLAQHDGLVGRGHGQIPKSDRAFASSLV